MGPRDINAILAEVSSKSDPQRQIVMRQISDLAPEQQSAETALGAKRDQGFSDIELGARRRGVAYWGAPIAEQQKYLATDYLPALANLKSSYNQRRTTLDAALADIGRNDYNTANDIFNNERNFYEQQRQYNQTLEFQKQQAAAQQAAARAAAAGPSPSFGGGGGAKATPQITQRADKGFNFTDGSGRAISASTYSQLAGIPFTQLLQRMAQSGDKGAQTYLAGSSVTNPNVIRALTWQ